MNLADVLRLPVPVAAAPGRQLAPYTLAGVLEFAGRQVAVGTLGYKHAHLLEGPGGHRACEPETVLRRIGRTQVNLKVIADVDRRPAIAQLVAFSPSDIRVQAAWTGPARLHLMPHVGAPVADLPVRRVLGGLHCIADVMLPFGRVLYDYKTGRAPGSAPSPEPNAAAALDETTLMEIAG